ncbi:hypothetical protein [Haloplanus halophilus]|uniref:hypothetical protein n=1 Tax=Haloplanus halophilus TaxID=2949993 RepID=UPI00203CD87C|nr:hypothetical protein [Haloplanus sp. GDY1]
MTGVTDGGDADRSRVRPPSDGRRGLLLGALVALVAVRLLSLPAVIHPDGVALLSNDPYFYRTLVDRTVAASALPPRARVGEPLFVATLAAAAALVGSSGVALAVYPLVATVLSGWLVHATATRVTDDPRVGLAAVLWLATVPVHAWRTSLGAGDHHAFDYLWVALTLCCLVSLPTASGRERRLLTAALGVAAAGQVLAWEAGPLLLLPAAVGVAGLPLRRPADAPSRLRPVAAGFGVAAALAAAVHAGLGWGSAPVVAAPALLCLGAAGATALAGAAGRTARPRATYAAGGAVGLGVAGAALWYGAPALRAEAVTGAAFLGRAGTWEMAGLFGTFGPALGPLILLGYAPFVAVAALPAAARGLWNGEAGWSFVTAYALVFGALAADHRRFAGEFAVPLAVLSGAGLVALLGYVGVVGSGTGATETRVESPDRRRALLLGGVALAAYAPGVHFARLVVGEMTVDPRLYRAARWIEGYARRRGLDYPANYVLSEEGRNRMFNYFVNGRGLSASFAAETYAPLLTTGRLSSWHARLADRVGFLVVRTVPAYESAPEGLVSSGPRNYRRLHHHLGSAADGFDGVGHYRAVYTSPDGFVSVFELVSGATIRGRGPPGERVVVGTTVALPHGTLDFRRVAVTGDDGAFAVTVPHPGHYEVGGRVVRVTERAVRRGATVTVGSDGGV